MFPLLEYRRERCCKESEKLFTKTEIKTINRQFWCASRRLQLNATKTEAVWFGTRRNLDRLHDQDRHVQIDSEIISPVTVVRDLGVYLDDKLSMKQHM